MAKKKIILANWDDSQRIGVAVESFEELKFKGITRLNVSVEKEVYLLQVKNGDRVENDEELMSLEDRTMIKIVSEEPKLDFSHLQLCPEQTQIVDTLRSLALTLDNLRDMSGNVLKILSEFSKDDIENYSKWFDQKFIEQVVSIASEDLMHRQMSKDTIIINQALNGGRERSEPKETKISPLWPAINLKTINILGTLFPVEIANHIKGQYVEDKYLNLSDLVFPYLSSKMSHEKFLFKQNVDSIEQVNLPMSPKPMKISSRIFGLSHDSYRDSEKWVYVIEVYRTRNDVEVYNDGLSGNRVYQYVHGVRDEVFGIRHKFEVKDETLSTIKANFRNFLNKLLIPTGAIPLEGSNIGDSREASNVGDSEEASKMQSENSFHLKIRMRFRGVLKNPLSLRYYVEKAFSTSFILFLLLEVLNFATDIAWNVEYYKHPEKFYQDFPTGNCVENFTIACHFTGMDQPERSILFVSLSIFLLTYLSRFIFVMACEKTRHYLATLVGYCCWDSLKKNQQSIGCLFISLAWFFTSLVNQIAGCIYGFFMQTFIDHWEFNDEQYDGTNQDCKQCQKCPGKEKCICVRCGQNATRAAKASTVAWTKLKDDSSKTASTLLMVEYALENSLMPLVQLSLLLPNVFQLFTNEPISTSERKEERIGINLSWRFTLTVASITFSVVSLAVVFTETYFAKPGRSMHKTKTRWIVFFLSFICQVVPKIFAYLVFSFGFVGYVSSNAIIPSLLILPLFMSMARAILYHYLSNRNQSCGWSMLFGLSTMYALNEDINADQFEKPTIDGKKHFMHLAYDTYSIIETGILTGLGVYYLKDANFDKLYFLIIMNLMQVFGKLFKGLYYLYFHPSSVNPIYNKFKFLHIALSIAFFVGFTTSTAIYSESHLVKILILCLHGVMLPITLLLILLRKHRNSGSSTSKSRKATLMELSSIKVAY